MKGVEKNHYEDLDNRVGLLYSYLFEELKNVKQKSDNLKAWLKDNPSISILKRIDDKSKSHYFILQKNFPKSPKQNKIKKDELKEVKKKVREFKKKRERVRKEVTRLRALYNGFEKVFKSLNRAFGIPGDEQS